MAVAATKTEAGEVPTVPATITTTETDMAAMAAAAAAAKQTAIDSLTSIRSNIARIAAQHPQHYAHRKQQPMLIAVSKLKPISLIEVAFAHEQRHFGENYVQELITKANDTTATSLTATATDKVQWHFIGGLQSNKCNQLLKNTPNLYAVHSVDSIKLANSLHKACAAAVATAARSSSDPLRVFVQVNTSGEASKSGCLPSEALALFDHIHNSCDRSLLRVVGLMTIGRLGDVSGETDCYETLVECRKQIVEQLLSKTADNSTSSSSSSSSSSDVDIVNADNFEMSMGMSGDYELAMQFGATMIRVGSSIFGSRDTPNVPSLIALQPPEEEEAVAVPSVLSETEAITQGMKVTTI